MTALSCLRGAAARTVLSFVVALSWVGSPSCRRAVAPVRSALPPVVAARTVGIALPPSARDVRSYDESLFTLTCVLSFELPSAEVSAFVEANDVLPPLASFSRDTEVERELDAVGRAAPWWGTCCAPGTVYGAAERHVVRGGTRCLGSLAAALSPTEGDYTRILIVYVEEAAPP